MTKTYLDKIYQLDTSPETQRAVYETWAASYDNELTANGYVSPGRVAAALEAALPDPSSATVLDFGCGTGMSGEALAAAGFRTIDGCDLSAAMVEQARTKGIYRRLWEAAPGVLDVDPADYDAIAACGVISPGAGPPSLIDLIAGKVRPGGVLAFTLNQYGQADTHYTDRVAALLAADFTERSRETGPNIQTLGSETTVYVLERRS